MSQRSLAIRSGLTQAAISRIESGKSMPRWDTVCALTIAMGLEPSLEMRRLRGRWDPLQLADLHRLSSEERLKRAVSTNRFVTRLRQAGEDADRSSA